jgi:hypothetical protein
MLCVNSIKEAKPNYKTPEDIHSEKVKLDLFKYVIYPEFRKNKWIYSSLDEMIQDIPKFSKMIGKYSINVTYLLNVINDKDQLIANAASLNRLLEETSRNTRLVNFDNDDCILFSKFKNSLLILVRGEEAFTKQFYYSTYNNTKPLQIAITHFMKSHVHPATIATVCGFLYSEKQLEYIYDNDIMMVECNNCKKLYEIKLESMNDYYKWKEEGEYIQTAMPYLSAGERELLISATCNDCWHKMFDDGFEDHMVNEAKIDIENINRAFPEDE